MKSGLIILFTAFIVFQVFSVFNMNLDKSDGVDLNRVVACKDCG